MNIHDAKVEAAKEQDERELALGDTLDIKTSIVLVIITFLATQSETLLKATEKLRWWHIAQRCSVVFLVIAGLLAIAELIPRKYRFRMPLDEFLPWANGVLDSYKRRPNLLDPETEAVAHIENEEIEKAKDRFLANREINDSKSRFMKWSFRATFAALLLNLATLAYISYSH